MAAASDERLRILYTLTCEGGREAFAAARRMALCGSDGDLRASSRDEAGRPTAGRVEGMERLAPSAWTATVSFDFHPSGDEVARLARLLTAAGLACPSAMVREVAWPASMLERFAGPAFGADGLLALLPAGRVRPLRAQLLGAVGDSAEQLAQRAATIVEAGADLVLDRLAPEGPHAEMQAERSRRCAELAALATDQRGSPVLYAPYLSVDQGETERSLGLLHELGVQAAVLMPNLAGAGWVRELARISGLLLVVVASATACGVAGALPSPVLGELWRILGADVVILPLHRAAAPSGEAHRLHSRLRRPLGHHRSAVAALVEDSEGAVGEVTVGALPRVVLRTGAQV